ncbi:MAG: protein translocase subunit SecD, partial [Planctomycetota bacterium]
MGKNLFPKVVLIIVLIAVAFVTLYPPDKTLIPGIDLAGGTSFIFEIDTFGMTAAEQSGLSSRMITVLRRRIDPANIQNLIWRPQGNTRFEIQMPLASAEVREKRQNYENLKSELLSQNINPGSILGLLKNPSQQRAADFNDIALGIENRLEILTDLAIAYDEREALRIERGEKADELKIPERVIEMAGISLEQVKRNLGSWILLDEQELETQVKQYATSEENIENLKRYVAMYKEWADVVDQLTNPEFGKNIAFGNAKKELDRLNLTEDRIDLVLEFEPKSNRRADALAILIDEFPDRNEKIVDLIEAHNDYRPFRGRLDDPKDLQRMLKGAGVLEFRILPTMGHTEVDSDEMIGYQERLAKNGPRSASDSKYVWCEIEKTPQGWSARDTDGRQSVTGQFGDKEYVLASNNVDQKMVQSDSGQAGWKLERARPSQDRMGRRAIGFRLNDRGGMLFSRVTGRNLKRPLCILLDGVAISAPNIESKIGKDGVITGNFSETEVSDMVDKLNAGSLPARLIEQPISVKTIGPSIGADNRDKGIKAGFVGLVVIVVCMAVYYMLAGAIADLALFLNLLFVLAIMAFARATFTLPGIAGFILTIGMSVDANVLIFERIREEQEKGSSLRIAIRNGYQRAFRTIFDANLTTFITAAILLWVASEEIKGFAIVLMLGIVSSMFTALFVTRVVFDMLLARRIIKDHLLMLRLIRRPNIDWMKLRPVFMTISIILIIAGLTVFFTRDDTDNSKYDNEFIGGTSAVISFKDGVEITRQQVADMIHQTGEQQNNPGIAAARVYSVGESYKISDNGVKLFKQYEINTTETNKTSAIVKFDQSGSHTAESVAAAIKKAQLQTGSQLSNLRIVPKDDTFEVITSRVNTSLVANVLKIAFPDAQISAPQVDEVVNNAIITAFTGKLEIQENLNPQITSTEKIDAAMVDQFPMLSDFLNGVKITCTLQTPVAVDELDSRLKELKFKPDMQDLQLNSFAIFMNDLSKPDDAELMDTFVYLSADAEAAFREFSTDEWNQFVGNEKRR